MQPIGWETATRAGDATSVEFEFTDRGSPVRLRASLTVAPDGSPRAMTVKGQTSRGSTIDRSVTLAGGTATVVEGGKTTTTPAPPSAFPSPGYAPLAVQEAMVRFWRSHGRPAAMPNLVGGTVRIVEKGTDTLSGRRLSRLSVQGVMWGRETLWTDEAGALVAGVMCDAEFDHFEGIAEGWEAQLPTFVARASGETAADLAASLPKPEAPKRLALVGGTLIDGTGRPPVPGANVLIVDGRIVAAGPSAKVPVPKGFTVIDASGRTVMPGLWDMHAHYEQAEWGPIYLASGVTTVRDCGNELEFIASARDANDRGGVGPRLLLAGLVDGTDRMALGVARVDTEAQVKEWVERYRRAGFRQIKIYSSVRPEMVPVVVREAHAAGLTVTGHIPDGMTIGQGIDAGMDMVNHISYAVDAVQPKGKRFQPLDPDSPAARALIATMVAHRTVFDDTLAIYESFVHGPAKPEEIEPGLAFVAPELRTPLRSMFGTGLPLGGAVIGSWARLVVAMQKAGVPVVAGTDQTVPGFSLHRELELYVAAGMAPMDAIRAACAVPAKAMGLDREVGTLEAGRRADVLIVDGDPLKDIADTRRVWMTLSKGRIFRPAPLWRSVGFAPPP